MALALAGGLVVTFFASFFVHPLVAAVVGILSMLPIAWLLDRR